jgi:hypothetical protein
MQLFISLIDRQFCSLWQINVFNFFSSKSVRFNLIRNRIFGKWPLELRPPLQGHRQDPLGLLRQSLQRLFVFRLSQDFVNVSHDLRRGVVGRNVATVLFEKKLICLISVRVEKPVVCEKVLVS